MSDDTWFWKIVDASGLEGVPSDEVEALSRIMDELRALRAALDAAEGERDALLAAIAEATKGMGIAYEAAKQLRAERDAALAARDAAERQVEHYGSTADARAVCITMLERERDAALAARDAAWRAGRDAAARLALDLQEQNLAIRSALDAFAVATSALQPPADLAAEAPGDAVARIEALGPALEVLEFHEGSAAPAVEGGEPVVQINGEDFQNALDAVRFAYKALATLRARAGA